MAARTASASGKWSNTLTWGSNPVPVDGDTVTINAGVIVEFDVDESGFATGLGAQTINGTLNVSNTAGTYYWKCAGTVTWGAAASYIANTGGVTGTALPANVTFTQAFNGNFNNTFNTTTTRDVNCQEPTHKYIKLTQNESSSATTLHVDTDISGGGADALWASPSLIRVDDINQLQESEQYTISSVTSTTVVLTSGLTNAKSTGAYVILISRNVKIIQIGATNGIGISSGTGGTMAAEVRGFTSGYSGCTTLTIGGTISGCTNGIISSNSITINAPISGCTSGVNSLNASLFPSLISGCTTGIVACVGAILSGIISGCTTGLNLNTSTYFSGTISGCQTGIASGNFWMINATLTSNTRDVQSALVGSAYNTLFGSATEYNLYNGVARQANDYFESFDHDQVSGAFRAWCRGGIVNSIASPAFDASRVRSYQHVPESTTYPVFKQEIIRVPAGASLYVRCYVQKDASMSYLPRLWVMTADKEPLISGSPDSEVIMTNSTNTWEILETTLTNSSDAPKNYIVRTIAKNASGNVYFDPIIRMSSYQPQQAA